MLADIGNVSRCVDFRITTDDTNLRMRGMQVVVGYTYVHARKRTTSEVSTSGREAVLYIQGLFYSHH